MIAIVAAAVIALQASTAQPAGPSAAKPSELPPPLLSLKQLTLSLSGGDTPADKAKIERFRTATQTIAGCDAAERIAAEQGAGLVDNNAVPLAMLPKPLGDILATLPVGRATPLYGSGQQVRVVVLCARD